MSARGTESSRLLPKGDQQDREIDPVLEKTVGILEEEDHGSPDLTKDEASVSFSGKMKSVSKIEDRVLRLT